MESKSSLGKTFTLVVGTDSTWSLRAWMCAKLSNTAFDVKVIDLAKAHYKEEVLAFSSAGQVPVLLADNHVIHDSVAISEFFNDLHESNLFPEDVVERALARSLIAELHAGFIGLRSQCPFKLKPANQPVVLSEQSKREIKRVEDIFSQAKCSYMFGSAGAVDAFYAILAFRLNAYGITFTGKAGDYQQSLLEWSLLQSAIKEAVSWKNGK